MLIALLFPLGKREHVRERVREYLLFGGNFPGGAQACAKVVDRALLRRVLTPFAVNPDKTISRVWLLFGEYIDGAVRSAPHQNFARGHLATVLFGNASKILKNCGLPSDEPGGVNIRPN